MQNSRDHCLLARSIFEICAKYFSFRSLHSSNLVSFTIGKFSLSAREWTMHPLRTFDLLSLRFFFLLKQNLLFLDLFRRLFTKCFDFSSKRKNWMRLTVSLWRLASSCDAAVLLIRTNPKADKKLCFRIFTNVFLFIKSTLWYLSPWSVLQNLTFFIRLSAFSKLRFKIGSMLTATLCFRERESLFPSLLFKSCSSSVLNVAFTDTVGMICLDFELQFSFRWNSCSCLSK